MFQEFRGNEDGDTIVQNTLADPVEARYGIFNTVISFLFIIKDSSVIF